MFGRLCALGCTTVFIAVLGGCVGVVPIPKGDFQLTVTTAGGGSGTVTSTPAGINCPGTCTADFPLANPVTLTASPTSPYTFTGWSGGCSGTTNPCAVSVSGNTATATAAFGASLQSINHVIFLAQENRSLDSYFGALRDYWAANGIPDQQFDGLPQFTPPANPAAAPTNPDCDPTFPDPTVCQIDAASPPWASFHMTSLCMENLDPSWAEAHRDWNVTNPISPQATLDGFVEAAAHDARQHVVGTQPAPFFDVNGHRAMGYYDGTDLNYYYALASTFSTSDTWFSPVMTRTPPNREYLIAGTSSGYVYQRNVNPPLDTPPLPGPTIFEAAQNHNPPISWKIYVNPAGTPCATPPADTDPACLIRFSYLHDFTFGITIKNNPSAYTNNIVNIAQFYTDAVHGTLPAIAQIEPASSAGLDEHPIDNDPPPGVAPCCSVQSGAKYVATLINAVMCGVNGPPSNPCDPTQAKSWADSAFILTWDEFGGLYDHVAPVPTVSPDNIPPLDLFPNDVCYQNPSAGPTCDFTYTGYRVPVVVVSPFSKSNFVSHQTRDYTAILKLIESRFGLNPLTNRDAAQVGMDDDSTGQGFFDFTNIPWKTPPTLPAQNQASGSACFLNPPP